MLGIRSKTLITITTVVSLIFLMSYIMDRALWSERTG
jgi:hypothetical protein